MAPKRAATVVSIVVAPRCACSRQWLVTQHVRESRHSIRLLPWEQVPVCVHGHRDLRIRWPGHIAAGTASNEIVHEMDLFPTFARIAGGKVPDDRVIDGMDMSDFLLGEQEDSGREGIIVYMGNDVFGVKWRDWKVNFKELNSVFSETVNWGMPRVYNLLTDPQERENVLFPNTWVPKAALGQLGEHAASLQANPPIKPGTLDPYVPAK